MIVKLLQSIGSILYSKILHSFRTGKFKSVCRSCIPWHTHQYYNLWTIWILFLANVENRWRDEPTKWYFIGWAIPVLHGLSGTSYLPEVWETAAFQIKWRSISVPSVVLIYYKYKYNKNLTAIIPMHNHNSFIGIYSINTAQFFRNVNFPHFHFYGLCLMFILSYDGYMHMHRFLLIIFNFKMQNCIKLWGSYLHFVRTGD